MFNPFIKKSKLYIKYTNLQSQGGIAYFFNGNEDDFYHLSDLEKIDLDCIYFESTSFSGNYMIFYGSDNGRTKEGRFVRAVNLDKTEIIIPKF